MIENVTVLKARIDGEPLFVVGYFDLEKKDEQGYFRTTKYGTEAQMKGLLKSFGVPDAEVDQLFEKARL